MLNFFQLIFKTMILYSLFEEIPAQQRIGGHENKIPIIIKDDGLEDLSRGDVVMVFYITVTNIDNDMIHLYANAIECCQTITENDKDCESMRLHGGDMGKLYRQDTRNLTLLFANLYPHDRVGSCEIEIKDSKNVTNMRTVNFNTKLVRNRKEHIPRLLEKYYSFDDLATCDSVDEDPLSQCQPYSCAMRYNGFRNYFNYTSKRCEKIPQCSPQFKSTETIAYILETNDCKALVDIMTKDDFLEFKSGKPSVRSISRAHSYPINVQCHNGKRDPYGRWCKCFTGWDSAPFDHKSFNMDVQVYHMCTVWLGKMSDEQARNITYQTRDQEKVVKIIIISLFVCFIAFVIVVVLCILFWDRRRRSNSPMEDDAIYEEERAALTLTPQVSESE
ncbi:uncharacterized protein [Parasteatoda tepidariorum]|uniref:uncharacterized protein n=1 Tax=Parasteatoda tepidariorum TaxID=114398 RepID=UPI0039BCAAC6